MRTATLLLLLASSLSAQTPEELFKAGKYDEAKKVFAERVAKNKNDANALFYMGRIAEENNNPNEAVDWYEKASQLDPKMLEPRMGLVDFYTMAPGIMGGSIEKAHQQANEIKKLHP